MAFLRSDTALRIFPNGTSCEVAVAAWTGIDGNPYGEEPDTWNSEFSTPFEQRSVGHGATSGFVVVPKPGQFS